MAIAGILATASQANAADESHIQQVSGIAFGGEKLTVYVARDKASWDAVRKGVGLSRLPADRQREPGLPQFNGVDFQKQMIVAVFWGEMNFAGHDEKCWIESVGKAKDADGHDFIKVDCQANLWGGEILRSYTAYPYHVMVVPRSNLPVKFLQTVRYRADKARGEKDKILATLGPNAWKQELAEKLENANSQ